MQSAEGVDSDVLFFAVSQSPLSFDHIICKPSMRDYAGSLPASSNLTRVDPDTTHSHTPPAPHRARSRGHRPVTCRSRRRWHDACLFPANAFQPTLACSQPRR